MDMVNFVSSSTRRTRPTRPTRRRARARVHPKVVVISPQEMNILYFRWLNLRVNTVGWIIYEIIWRIVVDVEQGHG